jgi:hypothetical protein
MAVNIATSCTERFASVIILIFGLINKPFLIVLRAVLS